MGALPATMVGMEAATISAEADMDAPALRRARQVGKSPTRTRKMARRVLGPAAARLLERSERRELVLMLSSGGVRVKVVILLEMRLSVSMMKAS